MDQGWVRSLSAVSLSSLKKRGWSRTGWNRRNGSPPSPARPILSNPEPACSSNRKEVLVIAIPRTLARRFRAVLRLSLLDKEPRGSWPLVLFQASKDGLVLQACQSDMAVRYHLDGTSLPEPIGCRPSELAAFEGRRDDLVELEQVAFRKGQATWVDGDVPKVIDLETVTPDS